MGEIKVVAANGCASGLYALRFKCLSLPEIAHFDYAFVFAHATERTVLAAAQRRVRVRLSVVSLGGRGSDVHRIQDLQGSHQRLRNLVDTQSAEVQALSQQIEY